MSFEVRKQRWAVDKYNYKINLLKNVIQVKWDDTMSFLHQCTYLKIVAQSCAEQV